MRIRKKKFGQKTKTTIISMLVTKILLKMNNNRVYITNKVTGGGMQEYSMEICGIWNELGRKLQGTTGQWQTTDLLKFPMEGYMMLDF